MRYFQHNGPVFGYDPDDPAQDDLIQFAIENGWNELTGHWPPAPTLTDRVNEKRALVNATYEQATNVFKKRYPRTEIDGWPEQVRALEAYDADPEAANTLIDILAQQNGQTRAQMAEAIRAARDRFVYAYANLTGLRQKLESELDSIDLSDSDALNQITQLDETRLAVMAQQLVQDLVNTE